ncbi:MAG: hypothetical protein GY796_13490 [Chloroflexi bacterium]|nr:hypothetical protein [Chloroflexota bacterium]
MKKFLQSRAFPLILGLTLIVGGLFFASRYAEGVYDAYREMEFAHQYNFDAGNPDVDLLQPWMNIRYIAVAYTVPQAFLFEEIGMEMNRVNSESPIGRLNEQFSVGWIDDQPVIIIRLRDAILKYHNNPVVTGLAEDEVDAWMNIQYIANSTGIPPEYIFEQIGIPMDGHAFMPLSRLIEVTGYELGKEVLVEQLQQIIDSYEEPSQ